MPEILIFFALIAVPLIWFVANYNRFVRLRRHLEESWSNIDVELKRRHDLIPNLVNTVKGYAGAREGRSRAPDPTARRSDGGTAARRVGWEQAIEVGLAGVFAVAEAYPRLKADAHFLALQKELALTEDRIAAARRFYNGNVRDLNNLCEQFPTSIIASMFGFATQEFFELGDPAQRSAAHRMGAVSDAAGSRDHFSRAAAQPSWETPIRSGARARATPRPSARDPRARATGSARRARRRAHHDREDAEALEQRRRGLLSRHAVDRDRAERATPERCQAACGSAVQGSFRKGSVQHSRR